MVPHQSPAFLEELLSESRYGAGLQAGWCTLIGTLRSGNDCRTARAAYRFAVHGLDDELYFDRYAAHAHEREWRNPGSL